MLEKRLPPGMSGSPAVDGIFQTLWLGIISVQLWGFLYIITLNSVREGPLLTAAMFAFLLVLLGATILTLGNRIRH